MTKQGKYPIPWGDGLAAFNPSLQFILPLCFKSLLRHITRWKGEDGEKVS